MKLIDEKLKTDIINYISENGKKWFEDFTPQSERDKEVMSKFDISLEELNYLKGGK